MAKKNNFSKIHPSTVKDQNGKDIEIYLKYDEYESILKEIDHLNKKIFELKKEKSVKVLSKKNK